MRTLIVTQTSHIPTLAAESHKAAKISGDTRHRAVHLRPLILNRSYKLTPKQVKGSGQHTRMLYTSWLYNIQVFGTIYNTITYVPCKQYQYKMHYKR